MSCDVIFTSSAEEGMNWVGPAAHKEMLAEIAEYATITPTVIMENYQAPQGDSPWRLRDKPERGFLIEITFEQILAYCAERDVVCTVTANDAWDHTTLDGADITHTLWVSRVRRQSL